MNHTLFFLNATGRDTDEDSSGYLFRNDFVIFDEAHTIESIAARQIGMEVSQTGLRYALHRLYNPRTRKGLLQALMQPAAVKLTAEIGDKADSFFGSVQSRAQVSRPSARVH
jgi:ATP-dependent DNA helicase DinG